MSDKQQPDRTDTGGPDAGGSENADDHDQRVEPQKAFEELSKLVLGEQSLTAVLQRVAELAKTTIPNVHEVSVTLMKDSQDAETVVFTGSLANQLDERQYRPASDPAWMRRSPAPPSGCPTPPPTARTPSSPESPCEPG